jgi:hypothetical protein
MTQTSGNRPAGTMKGRISKWTVAVRLELDVDVDGLWFNSAEPLDSVV